MPIPASVEIDINRWPDQYVDVVYSSNDGKRLYLQRYKRTWDEADICMVNVETGSVNRIHEKNKPYLIIRWSIFE
ncbi:MAG: hypothetical protein ACLU4J_06825 [Butyricimonas paravirosa]